MKATIAPTVKVKLVRYLMSLRMRHNLETFMFANCLWHVPATRWTKVNPVEIIAVHMMKWIKKRMSETEEELEGFLNSGKESGRIDPSMWSDNDREAMTLINLTFNDLDNDSFVDLLDKRHKKRVQAFPRSIPQ